MNAQKTQSDFAARYMLLRASHQNLGPKFAHGLGSKGFRRCGAGGSLLTGGDDGAPGDDSRSDKPEDEEEGDQGNAGGLGREGNPGLESGAQSPAAFTYSPVIPCGVPSNAG